MIRWCPGFRFIILGGFLALTGADRKPLWLTIAGSSKAVVPALELTKKLRLSSPLAMVVASSDCENLAQGFYLSVAAVANERAGAQAGLANAKSVAADANVRECRPQPNSRIQLGVPVVDPSIEKVPVDLVNWTDADRVSTVMSLPGGGFVWIRKMYEAASEDPREGRRTAVYFFQRVPAESIGLNADCTDPSVSAAANRIALACARETAAENLLHETVVYDRDSGKELMKVPHCRNPNMISASELTCQAEHVDSEGILRLHVKTVRGL